VKIRIAIDFDGVLADTFSLSASLISQRYGYKVEKEDLKVWNFADSLGLNEDETQEVADMIFTNFDSLKPIYETLPTMQYLNEKFEIFLVTYRKERREVLRWLERQGINFDVQHTSFPRLGDTIPEVDYALDDSPKKLAELRPYVSNDLFLFDAPHNRNCVDVKGQFVRIDSWRDFKKHTRSF